MNTFALNNSEQQWKEWLITNQYPAFQAKQIMQWIFGKGVVDPELFTNLSLNVRNKLKESFSWDLPTVDTTLQSVDLSQKLLLKTKEGALYESVLMPTEHRITLCISCQVGCKMGCTFCQTGKMGFGRNLTRGEILSQIIIANRLLDNERKVTNIVFMGMGEPLDNYDEVVAACRVMIDPNLFGLSKHHVTISTCGLIPEIERLGQELPVRLAISLHSADEEERSKLMPINRKYSLKDLKKVLIEYPAPTRYGITFEYVMIKGKNDSILHAKKLVSFLHGIKKVKVNLIPMNPFPGSPMSSTDLEGIRNFQKHLTDRTIAAPVRYSRGQDVSAACGQLAAKRKDELNIDPRVIHRERRKTRITGLQVI
jgi:23S rRNA (adenine2503-C2)-methyltransferase